MCKHAVKKLLFVIRYVTDQYKTQQMCNKVILENSGTLEQSATDCYRNQQMCDKIVDNYPHTLNFVPDCYKTQEICDKTVSTHHCTIQFVPECYKTQEICDEAVTRCYFAFLLYS